MKVNNLNPKYTFDNFILGDCNRFAYAAAKAVAEEPGISYNPLLIFGEEGLGKTHLMQAIGNEIIKNSPSKKVLYISSNNFIFDIVQSIKNNKLIDELYSEKYENIDVLLIDDVQFIAGKERAQEELFHIFNKMYKKGKQIVLTSDKPPKDIPLLAERLKCRFEWGIFADITIPEYELKLKVLNKKAKDMELSINNSILSRIAKNNLNIRQLEGIINQLTAISTLYQKNINEEDIERIMNFIEGGKDENLFNRT